MGPKWDKKKKFSQVDIDEKVKLAFKKKAAEDTKKQPRRKMSCYSRQSMQL